jgi:hypothetical protein
MNQGQQKENTEREGEKKDESVNEDYWCSHCAGNCKKEQEEEEQEDVIVMLKGRREALETYCDRIDNPCERDRQWLLHLLHTYDWKEVFDEEGHDGSRLADLFVSCVATDHELFEALVEKGIDLTIKNANGLTSMRHAALCEHGNIVKLLLERGVDVSSYAMLASPVLIAATRGSVSVLRVFLEHGIDCERKDEEGWTFFNVCKLLGENRSGEAVVGTRCGQECDWP